MRITILVSGMPPHDIGGTETQTDNMARHLAKRGHNVTVVARSVSGAPKEEVRNGFVIRRFFCIDFPVLRFVTRVIFSLLMLKKMRTETDVLQCMMIRPNGFVGALAKKLYGYRYITWLRSEYRFFGRARLFLAWTRNIALKNSDLILTQTESIRKEVLEDYPEKGVIAIPNGIDLSDTKANGDKIVFAGTLNERKGVRNLLIALRKIKESGMNLPKTLIIGDGPDREKLEKMAKGLPVAFLGKKMPDELKTCLKEGMFLVFPSKEGRGEGMPNVILEAMSVGLPVIASRIAGIPEMIEHGRTGFLVEPDNPDEIAKCIKMLMGNPKLRKRMGRNCLMEIRRYQWVKIISKLESDAYPLILKRA